MNKLILAFILSLLFWNLNSQDVLIGVSTHYSYQIPIGDFSKYYTNNSNVGLNLNIKLKSNITLGLEGQFLFGSDYKDLSLLGNMVTNSGYILGNDQSPQTPNVEGRGGNFFIEAGKIFSLNSKNKNSGWHIKGGIGYLFYSAYTNADETLVTQLSGNYANGYNRYESGFSINGFFGYTIYSKSKMINGSAGIQCIYAQTKYKGILDYATGLPPDANAHSSFLIGPKVNITIVLKRFIKETESKDGYFYN